MQYFNQKPIRLIELFAGIGSQAKALRNLDVDFEHWRVCEFDEHAIRSYNAVHDTNFVTSDITKIHATDLSIVDTDRFTYLLTYSFPCQDLSNAGLGKGMEKGSGTRSGLLWEVERLLNECDELPQVLLMENVPQVHGKKNMVHFEKWIEFLESKGYSNYWKDLNAKDYGMPQNRNRCYMVSILGEYSYNFPTPVPLTLKLGDMLENEVDEKYYLSDRAIRGRANSNFRQYELERNIVNDRDVHPTILARYEGAPTLIDETPAQTSELKRTLCNELLENNLVEEHDVIRHSYTKNRLNNGVENMARTESKEKLSPTLDTRCDCLGVVVKEDTLKRKVCNKLLDEEKVTPYDIVDVSYAQSRLDELLNGDVSTKNSENNQISNTITTAANNFGVCVPELRIRKLTPKECWSLMGFNSTDVEKAAKVCSNSQLYKQAGNSIVVNVLMAIFKELFIPTKTRSQWLDELLNN